LKTTVRSAKLKNICGEQNQFQSPNDMDSFWKI